MGNAEVKENGIPGMTGIDGPSGIPGITGMYGPIRPRLPFYSNVSLVF